MALLANHFATDVSSSLFLITPGRLHFLPVGGFQTSYPVSMVDLDRVEGLLQQYNPAEMHDESIGGSTSVESGGSAMGQAGYAARGAEREQIIPLPAEELKVGKRATESVKHTRTYVVEEPVQKDVQLRDERTVTERRPATGAATGQPDRTRKRGA